MKYRLDVVNELSKNKFKAFRIIAQFYFKDEMSLRDWKKDFIKNAKAAGMKETEVLSSLIVTKLDDGATPETTAAEPKSIT